MLPDLNAAQVVVLAMMGLSVGIVGAVVGVGGGFLLVPALLFIFPDADPATITSISLTAVFFNAVSASIGYRRRHIQDFRTAAILIAIAVPAAITGALVNRLTGRGSFEVIFGVVLIMGAIYLVSRSLLRSRPQEPATRGHAHVVVETSGRVHEYRVNEPLTATVAPVAGFFAGFFGIGGGIINVPIMLILLRIPSAVAVATSQLELAFGAAAALMVHIALDAGESELWLRAGITGAGALVGAQIGVRLAPRVGGRLVLGVIGAGLMFAGLQLLISSLGS